MPYSLNRLHSDLVALAAEAQAHALRSEGITSREVRGELYPCLVNAEDCGLAIVEWYADLWKEAAECKLAVERFIYPRLGIKDYLAFCELNSDELRNRLDRLQEEQPDLAREILDYIHRWHPKVAAELRHRLRPRSVENQPAATAQQPEHAYQADATVPQSAKVSTRRKKGEAEAILVAALCEWHGFSDGGCNRTEPIEVIELARRCNMARSTVSSFFARCFEGHDEYRRRCSEPGELVFSLKLLRGEVLPRHFKQHYSEPSDQDNDD